MTIPSTPNNAIRYPAPLIDFVADVGETGQDHDSYPAAGGQARYDWMRMTVIGLLAQQSSYTEPTQFREGTPWFDLNTSTLKIRSGDAWVPYADAIALTEPDTNGEVVTLQNWYDSVQAILTSLGTPVVFTGRCTADNTTTITIPEALRSVLGAESRVFLYINGSLVSPLACSLIGTPSSSVRLSGLSLSAGDTFVVDIRQIPESTFHPTGITAP